MQMHCLRFICMLSRCFFLLCFCCLHATHTDAQEAEVLLFDTLFSGTGKIHFASMDPFGNTFLVGADNRIIRYDSVGQASIFDYSTDRLGNLSHIDASNPLQVLLYYEDYQIVKFLNRNLLFNGQLDLNTLDLVQTPLVASAIDGNLWLYDAITFQLKKITPQGRILQESPSFNVLFNAPDLPTSLADQGDFLLVRIPNIGLCQFDSFGRFVKVIRQEPTDSWTVAGTEIYFTQADSLIVQDIYRPLTQKLFRMPSSAHLLSPTRAWIQNVDSWVVVHFRNSGK